MGTRSMRRHLLVRAAIGGMLFAVCLHLALGLIPVEAFAARVELQDWLYVSIVVAGALLVTARAVTRPDEKRAWALIAAGLALWALGEVVYAVTDAGAADAPFPSAADAFYLAFYVPTVAGILLLGSPVGLARRGISALVVASLGLATVWSWLFIDQVVEYFLGSATGQVVAVAYPALDMFILLALGLVLARVADGIRLWFVLLALGYAVIAVADSLFGVQSVHGAYTPGGALDALWLLGIVLIAVAALTDAHTKGRVSAEGIVVGASVIAALAAIAILVADHFERVDLSILVLASVTLALALLNVIDFYVRANRARVESEVAHTDTERARERLQAIIDGTSACVYVVDKDDRFVLVNKALGEITDRTADELIGRATVEVFGARIAAHFAAANRRVREYGAPVVLEEHTSGAEEPRIWISQKFLLPGPEELVAGISTEITSLRKAEAELSRRAGQQAAVARLGHDAVGGAERESLFSTAVESVRRELGTSVARVVESPPGGVELIERAVSPSVQRDQLRRLAAGPGSQEGFTLLQGAPVIAEQLSAEQRFNTDGCDGHESCMSVMIQGTGAPYGVLTVCSEQRRNFSANDLHFVQSVANMLGIAVERERSRDLERQLHHAQRLESVGELAGGIAHDFNNILGVILNYAEFVRREVDDQDLRKDVDEIVKAAERATALTRQLLLFSRPELVDEVLVDVNAIVSASETFIGQAVGDAIEVRTALEEDLPAVKLGAGQLEQVLVNLALNAGDAMPDGGEFLISTRRVVVGEGEGLLLAPGEYVELSVTDTGTGMSEEVARMAFDPFFTTKSEGTGLGLASVFGIVRQAGGRTNIETAPGAGTTVSVILPSAGAGSPPAGEGPSEAGSLRNGLVSD